MPTYTYKCKQCNYEFEEFQSINSDVLSTCPSCNKDTLVRIISGGTGLIFKGSGFYLTDYKNNKNSPPTVTAKEPKKTDSGTKNPNISESSTTKTTTPKPNPE